MPDTFIKIASVTVGSGGASSIDFTSIPSTYTDLCIKLSSRSANASNFDNPRLTINSSTSTFSRDEIYAETGSVGFESVSDRIMGTTPASNATSSTFGSLDFYLPSYSGSNIKSFTADSVTENNSSTQSMWLLSGIWATTSAITDITISLQSAGNFVQYSTATLYGIKNS